MDWSKVVQQFERLRNSRDSDESVLEQAVRLVLQNQTDAPDVIQTLLSRHHSSGKRLNTTYLCNEVDRCTSEDVNLPQSLLSKLDRWAQNPSSFWDMLETIDGRRQSQYPITLVYNRLQAGKEEHSVVRRLSVLMFSYLVRRIAAAAQLKTSTEVVQKLALDRICEERGTSQQEKKRVGTRVKEYLKAAAVYQRVIDRSELGIILLLPDKIPHYIWERYLPRNVDVVDSIIERLEGKADVQLDYQRRARVLIESLLRWASATIEDNEHIRDAQLLRNRAGRNEERSTVGDEMSLRKPQEPQPTFRRERSDSCGKPVIHVEAGNTRTDGRSPNIMHGSAGMPQFINSKDVDMLPDHVSEADCLRQEHQHFPHHASYSGSDMETMESSDMHGQYPDSQRSRPVPSTVGHHSTPDARPGTLVALHRRPYAFTRTDPATNMANLIESIPFHSSLR